MSNNETSRDLIAIRPSGAAMQKRICTLLGEAGYALPPRVEIPKGASDEDATAALDAATDAALWVVPFNAHRLDAGKTSDGIAPLLRLVSPGNVTPPILMPVSEYSRAASFGRRMTILKHERPALFQRVYVVNERHLLDDLGFALRAIAREVSG